MSLWKSQLHPHFKALDHEELLGRYDEREEEPLLDDFARLAFAFALLAGERRGEADALLDGVAGDGSASLGDLAYVRAFRRELDGDLEGMLQVLSAHLNDEGATHGARMRLRVADGLVKLRRFDQVSAILKPLLEPPGVPETLEAYFIVLEGMLQFGSAKEKVIEHVSVMDGLIERGFRLREAGNVVYYASLCQDRRIEPLVAALLKSHERLLDGYKAKGRAEVEFLLTAGDRHKIPAAVRAAGRAYVADPFPWEGDLDPEKVSYLFSSHEEHEAARRTMLASFPASRLRKDSGVWGPLLLSTFQAGKWKEALTLLRDHRTEIPRLPFAGHCAMIRVVCQYHLGRFQEAHQSLQESRDAFTRSAGGPDAAVEVLLLAALGRREDIPGAIRAMIAARGRDNDFLQEYFQTALLQLVMRRDLEAFRAWGKGIAAVSSGPTSLRATLRDIGNMALEWGGHEIARETASLLRTHEDPVGADALEGGIAALMGGDRPEMERLLGQALAKAPAADAPHLFLQRARWRRLLGDPGGALADLDNVLEVDDFPFLHRAYALLGALRESQGSDPEHLQVVEKQAGEWLARHSRSREEFEQLHADGRRWFQGDSARALSQLLAHRRRDMPGNPEVLRLARRLEAAPDATEQQRTHAREARGEWEHHHLLPPWP